MNLFNQINWVVTGILFHFYVFLKTTVQVLATGNVSFKKRKALAHNYFLRFLFLDVSARLLR